MVLAGLALAAQARASGSDAGPDAQARAGAVWHQALLLACIAGVLGSVASVGAPWLLAALGQSADLAPRSGHVAMVLGLGFPAALIALATAGFLEAVGRAGAVAVAVVLANVLNIGLNWLFIGGHVGFVAQGAAGSAWSTTLVRWTLAAVLFAYAWNLRDRVALGVRRRFDGAAWRAGREQRERGYSAAGTVAVLVGLSTCVPLFAGRLGQQPLAELTALWLLLSPFSVIAWGMSDAAGLRVASTQGAAPPTSARIAGRVALVVTALVLCAVGLPYLIAPAALATWAVADPGLALPVAQWLAFGVAIVIVDALSFVTGAALRSIGELKLQFAIHVASGLILPALALWLAFERQGGLAGLLIAILFTSALRAVALNLLFERRSRQSPSAAQPSPAALPNSIA
jgi:multidrug resistance protein, MATE family